MYKSSCLHHLLPPGVLRAAIGGIWGRKETEKLKNERYLVATKNKNKTLTVGHLDFLFSIVSGQSTQFSPLLIECCKTGDQRKHQKRIVSKKKKKEEDCFLYQIHQSQTTKHGFHGACVHIGFLCGPLLVSQHFNRMLCEVRGRDHEPE